MLLRCNPHAVVESHSVCFCFLPAALHLLGVVTNLLNQYLGQFLEGLDADQLKVSIWGGELNLVDVKVKATALDFLHLPIIVKYGYLKNLNVSANWRHLGSRPVKAECSGLYVVAVPSDGAHVDRDAEIHSALNAKLAGLQALEELQ
jgi:vacuolar protein sorting-associated protein 13A/C